MKMTRERVIERNRKILKDLVESKRFFHYENRPEGCYFTQNGIVGYFLPGEKLEEKGQGRETLIGGYFIYAVDRGCEFYSRISGTVDGKKTEQLTSDRFDCFVRSTYARELYKTGKVMGTGPHSPIVLCYDGEPLVLVMPIRRTSPFVPDNQEKEAV